VFITIEERLGKVLDCIARFRESYEILPKPSHVFNMFRMIRPDEVKVVMIGQSPYPGCCPATNTPYAYGPAFFPNPMCATTPATLRNIVAELCRDMRISHLKTPPNRLIEGWIGQGVMLLNASMTLGVRCPRYLEDHSVLWEEVMRGMVRAITAACNSPICVLIGRDAWKFEECITSKQVVKVSHPVARAKSSVPWMGSGVFSTVSRMMLDKGLMPIQWV
jgi:uracil-DNA glycosylase